MLGCYFNIEVCSNITCYRVNGITEDLTSTLRHYVALNAQLEVTLCYCVTVGAEIALT